MIQRRYLAGVCDGVFLWGGGGWVGVFRGVGGGGGLKEHLELLAFSTLVRVELCPT